MCLTVNFALPFCVAFSRMSGKIYFFDRLKMRIPFFLFYLFNGFIIGYNNAYNCCDVFGSRQNTDCLCLDQTGGVGTCSCTTLPNTRQGWLCKNNANGDSVNLT